MEYLQAVPVSIIRNLQLLNPLILAGAATLLFWLILSYRNSGAWKLRKFPTAGPTFPVLSLIGIMKYMGSTHNLVAIGRRKWPGRIFKIASPQGWQVVITTPTHIDDVRKAPEHILSAEKAVGEFLQTRFTLNRYLMPSDIHIPVIKTRLTREITVLVTAVYEEVVEACNQYLPATFPSGIITSTEWTDVVALESMTTIVARAVNRVFVGPILCRNPDWIKICTAYTLDVAKTAFVLHLFPSFLRPLISYFACGKVDQCHRDGLELLRPFIAARRDEERTENFNDFLTWLIDESQGKDREDLLITARILGMNFAAIHTSSIAVTHALFYLASNPEYLKPLREEVEEVTKREGWTKGALDQMRELDSFLKESQRLHPPGVLLMGRYAVVDYTFSDGTSIPAGTMIGVSPHSAQLDPRTYEDPLKFDGFRFIKMKERATLDGHPDKKFDLVTINADFVGFGQGRHACPGRYFASALLKIMLAYVVTTYDMKLVDGVRPPDLCRMNGILPNPTARVYFRRRQ